jgi:hypothetical protein
MRTAVLAACATLAIVAAHARAEAPPRSATSRAQAALDSIDAQSCVSSGSDAGRFRVAIVVYPDGGWALAFGPPVPRRAVEPATVEALRACVDELLRKRLGDRLAGAPSTVTTLARVVSFSEHAPAPAAGKGLYDGSLGAICAWGRPLRDDPAPASLPELKPCRAGLVCCPGGHPAANSACVTRCLPSRSGGGIDVYR